MAKARLYFDGDNSGIEKEARIYGLTQEVEDKLDSISNFQDEIDDLQDQINNLASRGRYLSTWNCVTGLPGTDPQVDPYVYRAGDYYIVSNVGGTNLRPTGAEYHAQVPSQVVESQSVSVNDLYIYDGIQWVLQGSGSSIYAVWGSITGTLSAQTDLQNALDAKANKTDVLEKTNTTAFTPTADYHPATKKYVDDEIANIDLSTKQDKLTAGNNIQISNANVISATDTTYNAGENITIEDICTTESDMKGPAPSGFHVPLYTEWQAIYDIRIALGGGSTDGANFGIALKLPLAGNRSDSSSIVFFQGTYGSYRSSSRRSEYSAYFLRNSSTAITPYGYNNRANGFSIRCFKNSPVVPTSSWTKLYGTSIEVGGIFWSSTDGLISLSSDGQTWITITDKNLGATTVWNSGDTLSEANCGKYYQRGNNYGFPRTGSVTTSSTQVDASVYGPGNYYSSNTFILNTGRWDTTDNGNLWGGVTQGTWQDCIPNVISAEDTTYTAGNGINIDANNEITADTTVLATKTDLSSKANAADVNTKTFNLSSNSDLTTAQAAYDWWAAGGTPIISMGGTWLMRTLYSATVSPDSSAELQFVATNTRRDDVGGPTGGYTEFCSYFTNIRTNSAGTVTSVTGGETRNIKALDPTYDYPTPYTPQYNGSPATKKYVDDSVISTQTGNLLQSGMKIWAGTESDYSSLSSYDSNTLYLTV